MLFFGRTVELLVYFNLNQNYVSPCMLEIITVIITWNYYSNTIFIENEILKSVGHNLCHVRCNCIN